MHNSRAWAAYWIAQLKLTPHPEGGFFRQTYRAPLTLPQSALPPPFHGDRSAATGIYFLLEGEDFSAFHRLASDEMWHFYAGQPLSVHVIAEGGGRTEMKLGCDPSAGEHFQAVVPAGCWFASCLARANTFALVGCTVSPGFDFADFEIATRSTLAVLYPQHRTLIERLTRDNP